VMIFLMLRVYLERKNQKFSESGMPPKGSNASDRPIPPGRKRRYNIHNPPW